MPTVGSFLFWGSPISHHHGLVFMNCPCGGRGSQAPLHPSPNALHPACSRSLQSPHGAGEPQREAGRQVGKGKVLPPGASPVCPGSLLSMPSTSPAFGKPSSSAFHLVCLSGPESFLLSLGLIKAQPSVGMSGNAFSICRRRKWSCLQGQITGGGGCGGGCPSCLPQ